MDELTLVELIERFDDRHSLDQTEQHEIEDELVRRIRQIGGEFVIHRWKLYTLFETNELTDDYYSQRYRIGVTYKWLPREASEIDAERAKQREEVG